MSEMNLTPFVSLSCCSSDLTVKWFSVHGGSIMPLVLSSSSFTGSSSVFCRLHSPALNRLQVCLSSLFLDVSDVSEALFPAALTLRQSHFPAMALAFSVPQFSVVGHFPSCWDSSRDHTFIETVTVRHVYFSMVSLFIIVIANRFSNILVDSISLRLLVKIIQFVAILKRMSLSWRMRLASTLRLMRSCFFFSSVLGYRHLVVVSFNFASMTSQDQAMMVPRSHSCLCAHFQLCLALELCCVTIHSAFSDFSLSASNFAPMASRWWISGHFGPALLCNGT